MKLALSCLLLAATTIGALNAQDESPYNEMIFSNNSHDRFVDVLNYLADSQPDSSNLQSEGSGQVLSLEVEVLADQMHVRTNKKAMTRNYNVPVTPQEKKDLSYILNTLARNSWASILGSKPALDKAGDRIDHLHPLRFLMTIFTDEELKADISAVKSKKIIWKKFFSGLEESLKQESQRNNMRPEYITDFANTVGINVNLINPSIKDKNWKEFVNILIDKIPRTGNPTRYDM